MNRFMVRTATVAFGALLSAGCATASSTKAAQPRAAATPAVASDTAPTAVPTATLAANMDTEIQAAQDQRAKGQLDQATQTLTQLMLVAPDDARVVGEYGKVLAQRGHYDDAIAFLKRAVELQPGDWTLYSAMGVAYDEANDRANAKLAYSQALALKPGEPVVLNNMAVSEMHTGDYEGAKKLLQQASANGSTDPQIGANLQRIADLEAAHPVVAQATSAAPVADAKPSSEKPVIAPKPAPIAVAKLAPPTDSDVPADPQAASHDPRKLAADAKPADGTKPAAKDKSAPSKTPALRTAAD